MNALRRRSAWVLSLVLVLAGCGQGGGGKPSNGPKAVASRPPVREVARPTKPASGSARVAARPKPSPAPPKLSIRPSTATIAAGDPGLQLRIEQAADGGSRHDLTAEAHFQAEPAGIVNIGRGGYVRPLKAGSVSIKATVDGREVAAVVKVDDPGDRPWDFGADVVPILTRFGCNTGACHGRADGQNGFHLSLFGYDPEGDYRALTREADGRRISLIDPEQSLLIRKATGRTPHGGGLRLPPNSDEYRTVLAWLAAGAPERRGKTHGAVVDVEVEPTGSTLAKPGPEQLRVVARFADGHRRDVTRLALYKLNDDISASVNGHGRARLNTRAEVDLIVRYQSFVVATRLATPINPDLKLDFAKLPRNNFIDDELYRRLAALRVPPSPIADDATFLRRATLDLTGQVPDSTEVVEFLKDGDPAKRAKLIDSLMKRSEFRLFWEIKLGDLFQITSARFPGGSGYYQMWLQENWQANTPWDKMIRELLTALGDPNKRGGGAANYALDGPDAKVAAELTAQRFLGIRMRCAQCHDHPFDVWTQDDYFGLAACFAKVSRGGGPGAMMARTEIKIDPNGKVEHLRTKKPAEPRLLTGEPIKVAPEEDPRKALADWMTRPDNPYFARAMANWVWAQFFGKGLADPADDLSRSNPPVHPELLDALARHFVAHHYDVRDLIRTVATSQAYGLASSTVPGNARDTRLFSHQVPRPLTAYQMADAIATVTAIPNRYQNRGPRAKAIEVFDPATPSIILDTFGRCSRVNGCSAVATPSLSLRQALLLMGGPVIDDKVASLNGYVSQLFSLGEITPEEVVEDLYLRALCRRPTPEEASHWAAELKAAPALREAAEDLFWALLNSREFAFNH